jgi:alpha-tubulin suppressor-like RCC1 family protein
MKAQLYAIAALAGALVLACQDSTSPEKTSSPEPEMLSAGTALSFVQMSAGVYHTCAVTTDSRAYCWGGGQFGRLGNGTEDHKSRPTAVAGGLRFQSISAGFFHTCGVTTDFRAYCWGGNLLGQLGDGTTTERLTPTPVSGGLLFREISTGTGSHTCGVTTGNKVYCWGYNGNGGLGRGSTSGAKPTPGPIASTASFRQVALGGEHSCAIALDYHAMCWGLNQVGQLGAGDQRMPGDISATPVMVAGGLLFRHLTGGSQHTCGVTRTSKPYCWGYGKYGQLGNGVTLNRWTPRLLVGGVNFDRLSAGWFHTCGESTTNKAYCWGYNAHGAVGDGSTVNRLSPVLVKGGLFFPQLDAGGDHACGMVDGAGYCWGENTYGGLGDGTTTDRRVPVRVANAQ